MWWAYGFTGSVRPSLVRFLIYYLVLLSIGLPFLELCMQIEGVELEY